MSDNTHSIEISVGNVTLAVSGSSEFVNEHFYDLSEKYGFDEIEVSQKNVDPRFRGELGGAEKHEEVDSSSDVKKSLNELLSDSRISTVKDKALVVGWYLETARGSENFTREEVEAEARSSKVTLGKNVGRDLGYQVEDGHLGTGEERDGDDTYWVTQTGLDYLDENGVPAR